jgi:hemoglobin
MHHYKATPSTFGERPQHPIPDPRFFEALGEDGFREMINNFYDKVIESDIAHFFPQDEEELEFVKHRNAGFFMEVCGGPKVYSQGHGNLDNHMVRMHKPFSITETARMTWLECMEETLDELDVEQELKDSFWAYIEVFSKWLVNTERKAKAFEDMVKK